jgi:hypothetical protein
MRTFLITALLLAASTAIAHAQTVPFQSDFKGQIVMNWDTGHAVADGNGFVFPFGPAKMHCELQVVGPATRCANGVTAVQEWTVTFANGDTLSWEMHEQGCQYGDTPMRYWHGEGDLMVTGGTGRFANVYGGGVHDGHADLVGNTFYSSPYGYIRAFTDGP